MTDYRTFAEWLGSELPTEYKDYLRSVDGRETRFGDVVLYEAAALIERNETYEVKIYCPGYFTVGDDGGGRAVVIRISDGSVQIVDHGVMTPEFMVQLSSSFRDWCAARCPLNKEDELSNDDVGPFQLRLVSLGAATPAIVAKELRRALSISVSEALALTRKERAVLMDSNRYALWQMEKCLSNLAALGATVILTRDS